MIPVTNSHTHSQVRVVSGLPIGDRQQGIIHLQSPYTGAESSLSTARVLVVPMVPLSKA